MTVPRGVAATTPPRTLGIDLGGTKIEAIALDDEGAELARRRVPAPRGDYGRTVEAIAGLVAIGGWPLLPLLPYLADTELGIGETGYRGDQRA